MRMGWVGEAGEVVCEPVPGVASRLKCRGQVIATTKTVDLRSRRSRSSATGPSRTAIADALMYADGKPIVEITNMSLRLTGLTREKLERDVGEAASRTARSVGWRSRSRRQRKRRSTTRASHPRLRRSASRRRRSASRTASSTSERVIARLPGPPYQFLDRIAAVDGRAVRDEGRRRRVDAEYDVPPDAWYFAANRSATMPFAVLLEIALQPCGWLAAYCGSALTSPSDLSFRNLGGKATQLRAGHARTPAR